MKMSQAIRGSSSHLDHETLQIFCSNFMTEYAASVKKKSEMWKVDNIQTSHISINLPLAQVHAVDNNVVFTILFDSCMNDATNGAGMYYPFRATEVTPAFLCGLCCLIFSFLHSFLYAIIYFFPFLLTIVLSILLWFMASDCHFGIFKLFLWDN